MFRNNRFSGKPTGKGNRYGRYIDPQKFINKSTGPAEQVVYEPDHRFTDFGLISQLQANVSAKGYEVPTRIQDQAIKPALEGKDVIGLANTGTGKTAAFLLPIIHRLKTQHSKQTVLIIAPTRELAEQIFEEFKGFSKNMGLYATLCVGGVSAVGQIQRLRKRPQFVIGTPGRLKDLYEQRELKLGQTGTLVLDEADRMLDMGFIQDIRYLIDKLPQDRQTLCFSATMTPDIRQLMHDILRDPVTVTAQTAETSDHVEQDVVYVTSRDDKYIQLQQILKSEGSDKVIVFGQAKYGVQRLADKLIKAGFKAAAIHGNKSQPQRQRALRDFKSGKVSILVATDVAARGLDIPLVSHVINFDQPATYEDYVHRIGRTGRAGNKGHALTFVERF